MTIVRSSSSWIVYAIAGAVLSERYAATAAAVTALLVLALAARGGRRGHELVIEVASGVFFVGYALLTWMSDADMTRWVGSASQFWLAAAVAYGLATHHPFTTPLAEREAPVEVHGTPWFHQLNVRLTRAWLVAFLASGVALLAAALTNRTSVWLSVACIALAVIGPTMYTRKVVAAEGA